MHELDIDDWNNDPEWVELEDLVFSTISPAEVHTLMADWGGTNYSLFIQALGILLRHQEQKRADDRKLTLEEMVLARNCGTYTLQ